MNTKKNITKKLKLFFLFKKINEKIIETITKNNEISDEKCHKNDSDKIRFKNDLIRLNWKKIQMEIPTSEIWKILVLSLNKNFVIKYINVTINKYKHINKIKF